MTVKKKKEPNSVVSNLNIVSAKGFCAYSQSRLKNVFKALEGQLEAEEFEKLSNLYACIDAENPDSLEYEEFASYAKTLIHKYAKKVKK